jgi:hypothetical protein
MPDPGMRWWTRIGGDQVKKVEVSNARLRIIERLSETPRKGHTETERREQKDRYMTAG